MKNEYSKAMVSAFCDDLHEPQKNPKVLVVKRKYFDLANEYSIYEKNKNLFHIRLQLIIWDKCFCFLLILMILQILNFFVKKNAQYCSHLCGEAAFAFAERENWLSFRSSLTYPNFQITCVEEQQFVRAWSKGQYVKYTSCSQFPHQNFGTFIAENLTKW